MEQFIRSSAQLGNALRSARKRRGLTQVALGNLAGLRQATISQLETGNPTVRLDTVLRVVAVLDKDLWLGPRHTVSDEEFEAML